MRRTCLSLALVVIVATSTTGRPRAQEAPPPLTPTEHPAVPQDPALLWLAPEPQPEGLPAPLEEFRVAVELIGAGRYGPALERLGGSRLEGPLGEYVRYYSGRAQRGLERPQAARATFAALMARAPVGYLAEAAAFGEAEAAEALGDEEGARQTYATIVAGRALDGDRAWLGLGRTASATGDVAGAAAAFRTLRYRYPLSDLAPEADRALAALHAPPPLGALERLERELGRAQRLFEAGRCEEVRSALRDLRDTARDDDLELVDVRLAACEVRLRHYAAARRRLAPYLESGTRQAEAAYWDLQACARQGRESERVRLTRWLVEHYPETRWAEAALDGLATHYIRDDQDDRAIDVFRELLDRYPSSRHADRAAWEVGWSAYLAGRYDEAAGAFESAAALHPRSNYRPAYLYWAGRAHEHLAQVAVAGARYGLTIIDYGSSYYGRRAAERVAANAALGHGIDGTDGTDGTNGADAARPTRPGRPAGRSLPPTADLIRALIGIGDYDAALNEIRWAGLVWGESPALLATRALIHNRRGELRTAVDLMKRAYPQYLTEAAGGLPRQILEILFPLEYWDLIQTQARRRQLDPYLLAALIAQESTFDPNARSAANAYGLMQVVPATGRRYARAAGVRYSRRRLTDPETNVRLGMTYFSRLISSLGELHLALAGYNAGDARVRRWLPERRGLEPDEFIDDIPFPETRNYVKRVLGTADDYRELYGGAAASRRAAGQAGGGRVTP